MIDENLLNFVKLQVENGVSRDLVVDVLLQNGWRITDINNAYSAVNDAQIPKTQTQSMSPISPRTDEPVSQNVYSQNQRKQGSSVFIKILVFIILLVFVAGLGLFVYLKFYGGNIFELVGSVPILKDFLDN